LLSAARELMTSRNPLEVSIKEITDTADVGFGSFYNHFDSKEEIFGAAVAEVLDELGAMLDQITESIEDPAEVFAASVRITVRLARTRPELAAIMVRTGPDYLTSEKGLAPRALRDLERAQDAGRLALGDPAVALACVAGAVIGVVHLCSTTARPVGRAADELAANLLRMFGLPAREAAAVVARRLPRVI
jgi:AcrR family transcriptional regulator